MVYTLSHRLAGPCVRLRVRARVRVHGFASIASSTGGDPEGPRGGGDR